MPTIVAVSDTHGLHERLSVPDGDILVHAGDLTRSGRLEQVAAFNVWLGRLPHKHKVVIAGNHDWCFERNPHEARALLTNAVYLQDEAATIEGLRFYGSPWQPEFFDWAFNLPRGPLLAEKWAMIPDDVDVLITHGPPAGILDLTRAGEHAGCEDLLRRIEQVLPLLHVFGHIHEAAGVERRNPTTFVNVSSPGVSNIAVIELSDRR